MFLETLQQLRKWFEETPSDPFIVKEVSLENLQEIARFLASICLQLKAKGSSECLAITLEGPLGSGKTTFCQNFISSLIKIEPGESPTYSYVIPYESSEIGFKIFHFDLYRLNSLEAFEALGLDECLQQSSICLIEWPSIILPLLPKRISIEFSYNDPLTRLLKLKLIHPQIEASGDCTRGL